MKKFILRLFKSTFIITTILVFQTVSIFALSPEQKKLYQSGIKYFNWSEECSSSSTPTQSTASGGALKSGDKVYILGDSITHGASAKYTELFSAKQITPTISGVTSRSWNGAGSPNLGATGTQGAGKDAIKADEAKVKESAAVIIALGTNGLEGSNPIDEVITKVNEIKGNVKIYWVNVAGTKVPGDLAPFNAALASKSAGKFTVIDWAKTVDPSGNGKNDPTPLLADGIHPNPAGYQKLAELVVNTTTSGGGGAPTTATAAVQGLSSYGQVLADTTTQPNNQTQSAGTGIPIPANPPVISNDGIENAKIADDKLVAANSVPNVSAPGGIRIRKELVEPLTKLADGFKKKFNRNISIFSGYRNAAEQQVSVDSAKAKGKPERAAPVGQSSHGWGLAVDLEQGVLYGETNSGNYDAEEYKWLATDGVALGWKNPYYKGHGGQASDEAWHWEYGTTNTWGAGNNGQSSTTTPKPASTSASCCSAGNPTISASSNPSENTELEYEDPARGNRKIGVTMWMPSGDASPRPLVVFAPGRGQSSKKDQFYKRYLQAIASKGFVVAGMNFSDNNSYEAAGRGADDVKFVIDKLLQEEKVKGRIDPATGVGVVGHSDGGFISLMSGYAEGKKHDRVSAVIAADGAIYGGVKNVAGPPLLLIHGTSDSIQNISSSEAAYSSIQTPYTAFAKVKGADHDKYITQDSSESKDAVDDITGAFLKRWLSKDTGDGSDVKKVVESKYSAKIDFSEKGSNAVTGNNSVSSAPVAATSPSCACTVSGAGLSGGDGEAQAWNYLIGKGMTPIQAAGSTGNMKHEGGFNPKRVEDGGVANGKWVYTQDDYPPEMDTIPPPAGPAGQPGYGIVQWTSPGRKNGLKALADTQGKPVYDMLLQLDYMWSELEGPYKNAALTPLLAATDLSAATKIWQDKYEVGAGFEPRFKSAQDLLAKYGSSAAAPTSTATATTPTGGGCGGGGGGAQGPTGGTLSWPMDPSKSVISQCMTPGGHPGMDIFIGQSDGPAIFAAADGTVTKAGPAGGYGPNFVVIQHNNGLGTSYGHMSKMSVKQGDTVTQGQQIGEQGNLGQSQGNHLHFNVFPGTYSGWDNKNVNPLANGLSIPPGVKNTAGCK